MTRWFLCLTGIACLYLAVGQSMKNQPALPERDQVGDEAPAARIDDRDDPDELLPGRAIARLGDLRSWQGAVRAVVFSPDGKVLASAGDDKLIRLWDVASRKEMRQLRVPDRPARRLAFSPDGKMLAASDKEGPIVLWDATTGKELRRLPVGSQEVFPLCFSPDGTTFIAWSYMLRAWDLATGNELPPIATARMNDAAISISCLVYSPEAKALGVASYGGNVYLHDLHLANNQSLSAKPNNCPFVAFSPDGRMLASCGGDRLRLWDVATKMERGALGRGDASRWRFFPGRQNHCLDQLWFGDSPRRTPYRQGGRPVHGTPRWR